MNRPKPRKRKTKTIKSSAGASLPPTIIDAVSTSQVATVEKVSVEMWATFAKALRAEPRSDLSIVGASGLVHQVDAIAVDDKGKRVIVVLAEPDPRTASLVRSDIQATMLDTHVLAVRPITVDLGEIARRLVAVTGKSAFEVPQLLQSLQQIGTLPKDVSDRMMHDVVVPFGAPFVNAFRAAPLSTFAQILSVVQQAVHFDWAALGAGLDPNTANARLSLEGLTAIDSIAADRRNGVCALPLYELQEADWELFRVGKRTDEIAERLKDLGVFQYFFPPPDQLALGLIDQGIVGNDRIIELVRRAPLVGHPLGEAEILRNTAIVDELCSRLKEKGLVAEGEVGWELTKEGLTVRGSVKRRPREGIFSVLLRSLKIGVSTTGMLGP